MQALKIDIPTKIVKTSRRKNKAKLKKSYKRRNIEYKIQEEERKKSKEYIVKQKKKGVIHT